MQHPVRCHILINVPFLELEWTKSSRSSDHFLNLKIRNQVDDPLLEFENTKSGRWTTSWTWKYEIRSMIHFLNSKIRNQVDEPLLEFENTKSGRWTTSWTRKYGINSMYHFLNSKIRNRADEPLLELGNTQSGHYLATPITTTTCWIPFGRDRRDCWTPSSCCWHQRSSSLGSVCFRFRCTLTEIVAVTVAVADGHIRSRAMYSRVHFTIRGDEAFVRTVAAIVTSVAGGHAEWKDYCDHFDSFAQHFELFWLEEGRSGVLWTIQSKVH